MACISNMVSWLKKTGSRRQPWLELCQGGSCKEDQYLASLGQALSAALCCCLVSQDPATIVGEETWFYMLPVHSSQMGRCI